MRATFMVALAAATALTGMDVAGGSGSIGIATAIAQEKVLRATMHADVRQLDPMWTTQVIASIHGNMIYDRLFASDEKLEPHPQMVETWTVSPDRKTYVFTLRDGLKFHDGTPVTTRDVIASTRRWAA
ncbi:MAG: ABC transporter substrate-binding protein, partial [Alphaproteobacteria bacterium]